VAIILEASQERLVRKGARVAIILDRNSAEESSKVLKHQKKGYKKEEGREKVRAS
jgi:hypothetical protein